MKLNWEYVGKCVVSPTPFCIFRIMEVNGYGRYDITLQNVSPHFAEWIGYKIKANKLSKYWSVADTEKDATDLCQNLISEYSNLIRELIS